MTRKSPRQNQEIGCRGREYETNYDDGFIVRLAFLLPHPLISLPQAVHAVGVLCIVNDEVARVGI